MTSDKSDFFRPLMLVPLGLLLTLGGCTENEIHAQPIRDIALVAGNFDNMAENLDRLLVAYQVYEGFICCASYDSDVDPETNVLKEETLFVGTDDSVEDIFQYDAVFLNSGARGWGEYEYNGVNEDNALVSDPLALENIERFVDRGGLLFISDWTYDLVEAIWPDKVHFFGQDEGTHDAAQSGRIGKVQARVVDEAVAQTLGVDEVTLDYNYSNWTVIEEVGEGVDVILSGDVEYRLSASDGYGTAQNVPLLLSMDIGAGQLVYSNFHWNAQTPNLADRLMVAVAPGLAAIAQVGD